MILLEESWSELFLLCAIQWSTAADGLLSVADHVKAASASLRQGNPGAADLKALNQVMNKFKNMNLDPAEYACLKAVMLFKPGRQG